MACPPCPCYENHHSFQPNCLQQAYRQGCDYGIGNLPPCKEASNAASSSTVELHTRLAVLETNYQRSQAESAWKTTVIQNLMKFLDLASTVRPKEDRLLQEISSLKSKVSELIEENRELRTQLLEELKSIFASYLPNSTTATAPSVAASEDDIDGCDASDARPIKAQDLIDFSDYENGSTTAELKCASLDSYDEYESDSGDNVGHNSQEQSAPSSFSLDFAELPYIHHFVGDDAAGGYCEGEKLTTLAITQDENFQQCPAYSVPDETPGFFKHGLTFAPSDKEPDVHRTVIISGIPASVTISSILDHVRGGAVLECNLLNTLKITGSNTARIIFVHEKSAFAYELHSQNHPLVLNGHTAQVAVVPTPTWPMKPKLHKAVFNHQQSRCLEVYNFPRCISPLRLENDLRFCRSSKATHLMHKEMRTDGILILQFRSVNAASQAFGVLSEERVYRQCTPYFVPDPCAQPLEGSLSLSESESDDINEVSINEKSSNDPPTSYSQQTTNTSDSAPPLNVAATSLSSVSGHQQSKHPNSASNPTTEDATNLPNVHPEPEAVSNPVKPEA